MRKAADNDSASVASKQSSDDEDSDNQLLTSLSKKAAAAARKHTGKQRAAPPSRKPAAASVRRPRTDAEKEMDDDLGMEPSLAPATASQTSASQRPANRSGSPPRKPSPEREAKNGSRAATDPVPQCDTSFIDKHLKAFQTRAVKPYRGQLVKDKQNLWQQTEADQPRDMFNLTADSQS